jgi:hypothetical protein
VILEGIPNAITHEAAELPLSGKSDFHEFPGSSGSILLCALHEVDYFGENALARQHARLGNGWLSAFW